MGNIDAAIKEYEILDFDIGAGPKNILYKALKEKSKSDKEIIKVLFPKLPASEGYYELYKMEENEKMDMIAAKLIKEYPDSPEANLIKASNLIKENKNDEALKLLNSIRSQITSEIEINDYNILLSEISSQPINEAEKLMDSGYPKKALELLENENIQESPELYCLKAKCYIALNEMQMALENLNNAMAMDSENPGVYLAFINYYIETGDTETARNYIEQAKELKSINEDNNVDEIVNYTKIVNKMDAEKYVDKITELYEQQRYEEAWNEIEKALKISDDVSSLHFYKGLVYIAKNNYAASTSEFYKAIELDENSVLSYYYLALAFDKFPYKTY